MINESIVEQKHDTEMDKLLGRERKVSKSGREFLTTTKKRATTVRSN